MHPVTLRRLLTHTAGLNRPPGGFAIEGEGIPSTAQVLNGELPAKNLPATVECAPGAEHRYSNFGYVIVQQLLEDVAKRSFCEVVQETVLEPVGMKSSTFEHPLPERLRGVTAVPHNVKGEPEEWAFHPTALGQGGLWTTPSDLARFAIEIMESHQGRSSKVLPQTMVSLMLSPEIELDPEKFFGLSGQGLGFFLMDTGQEFYFIHPGENAPGATCMLIAAPETGQGTVIMTNGLNGSMLQYETMLSIAVEYGWSIGGADAEM